MFTHVLRVLSLIGFTFLVGCGGGGEKSSVQVGNLVYTAHDFSLSPSAIKGAYASTQLSLYVKEQAGNQIRAYNNAVVTFESPCLLDGRARVSATQVVNGVYSASYTNMGCSGVDIIKANISAAGAIINPIEQVLTITDVVPLTGELTVTAANTNVAADGATQTAIRVLVTRALAFGEESTQPLVGALVNFSTTLGTLSSTTAITDMNGYATVFLIADTQPGTAIVSASSGGYVRTVSVGFGSLTPPERIIASATPGRVNPGGTATITSTVLDATGSGVPNVKLVFELTNNVSGGRLSSFSAVTNSQGIASIDYVAGNTITDTQSVATGGAVVWVAGYDVISINTNNGIKKDVGVRVNNDVTNFNTLIFTTGGSEAPADGQTKVLLEARVVGGDQRPLLEEEVRFTTTLGTLVDLDDSTKSTDVTGSDGVARLYLKVDPVVADTDVKVSASYKGVISTQSITFYPNP